MRENKKYQPLLWMMAMFACVLVMFTGNAVQASQINKDPFVDSITVDKSEAWEGESVNVKIGFSEKNGNTFKAGDEMVFDLPKELEGFKTSMKLEDYAIVTVESGRAVVKFTDKVSVKDHIKGKLSFNLQVKQGLAKDSENTLNMSLGTNVQNVPTLKVKGHKSSTGPVQPHRPAYKGGNVDLNDPTVLNWYIVINANRDHITGDINVTDALGQGHLYIEDSFTVSGKPGVTAPKVKVMGNKFSVTVPEALVNGETVSIQYKTRLTGAGEKMKELTNKFSVSFAAGHNNPQSVFDSVRVANLLMSGEIEGDDNLNQGTEGTVDPMPEETTDEIAPIVPDKSNESVEDNHLEDGIHGSKPEVHNVPKEEELPADEVVDEIAPIVPDDADEDTEGPHTEDGIHGSKPEVHIDPTEEVVPEEDIDVIDPIVPETGEESIEENHLEDGIHGSKPEVHIDPTEEVVPEEDVDVIDPITPEHIDGKVVEEDKVNPIKPAPKPDVKPLPTPKPDVKPMPVPKPHVKPTPAPKPDVKPTPAPKPNVKLDTKVVEPKTKAEVKKSAVKKTESKKAELPNTGSVDNFNLTILGLLGLVFAGFVMVRRGK